MQEIIKRNLNKLQSTENRIGILIIILTIVIFHFLSFYTKIMTLLPKYVSNTFFVGMILPGVFSAVIYALFTRKLIKIFCIGILTLVIWYVWIVFLFLFIIAAGHI